jgi:hypothetical protein
VCGTVKVFARCKAPAPDFGSERAEANCIDERRTASGLRLPKYASGGTLMNYEACFRRLLRQQFADANTEGVRHSTQNCDRRICPALLDLYEHPLADARALRQRIKGKLARLTQASAIPRDRLQNRIFIEHGRYIDYL